MAIRIILKLRATAPPHIYLETIKKMMAGDKYLHPLMRNALLLMKKTRMPYLVLATLKELIIVPDKGLHLERALQPQLSAYNKIDWSDEEKAKYHENPEQFILNVFTNYDVLGYEIAERTIFPEVKADELIKLCEKGPKKK